MCFGHWLFKRISYIISFAFEFLLEIQSKKTFFYGKKNISCSIVRAKKNSVFYIWVVPKKI